MKRSAFKTVCFVSLSAFIGLNFQCSGLSKKKIQDIENRVKILESKGVPDSVVSEVNVYLYNYNTQKKLGNGASAGKYADSVNLSLTNAEKWYQDFLAQNKASIESSLQSFQSQKANFSGIQLRTVDSMLSVIDSFLKQDLLIKAKDKIQELTVLLPNLSKNQEIATKTKPLIIGRWKDVHVVQAEEGNFKSTETSLYTFKSDGTFESSEEKKGQSTPFMKEDWQFLSWGKYDLKGDTVYLFVTREKCPRQIFTQLNVKDNKWVQSVKPTYDSTITNNGKDKTIPFAYLKQNFKKSK